MKRIAKILIFLFGFTIITANAYQIGNSYARLISCDFSYSRDYGESGYTGTYRTSNGNIYRFWFGSTYCPY